MKVLMTADCVGGVWTYACDLAAELTATGHEVVLAVVGGELASDQRRALETAGLQAFEHRPYRLEWMADADRDLAAAAEWLLELAQRHRPDLVHCNQFNVASLDWPCPAVVVAHSDVVTWWRAVHGNDPGPEWDGYRDRVTQGLGAAALVIAPTAATLRDLTAAYEFSTMTRVVHNGRRPVAAPGRKRPQMAAVGRVWDEAKNLAAAARAAQGLDWPLVIAGDGDAGVDGAQWLGRVSPPGVARLLAEASVFVAPARYEPFGLAALEAGQAGCALVLGDIPSLREVWAEAATYVDPTDEEALRSALHALISEPALLAERGQAAARRAARYDVGTMAAAYVDAYTDAQRQAAGRVAS